jgi:hypothetical protein
MHDIIPLPRASPRARVWEERSPGDLKCYSVLSKVVSYLVATQTDTRVWRGTFPSRESQLCTSIHILLAPHSRLCSTNLPFAVPSSHSGHA